MSADGTYARRTPKAGEAPRGAQPLVLERTLGMALPAEPRSDAPASPPPPAAAPRERAPRRGRDEPVEAT